VLSRSPLVRLALVMLVILAVAALLVTSLPPSGGR